jgi:S-adenosylmethionine:tRNA ribosyltransferase-isomerase
MLVSNGEFRVSNFAPRNSKLATRNSQVRVDDFHYELPPELIAQAPAPKRDQARLLVLNRPDASLTHAVFHDLPTFLRAGDLLVLNNARVLPARLHGVKHNSGGRIEVLLAEENNPNDWWVMLRPGKRVRTGTRIEFPPGSGPGCISAVVVEKNEEGLCRLLFSGVDNLVDALDQIGTTPLPPYIRRSPGESQTSDLERYQTVYAQSPGAVAAPTAGLHFTPSLLTELITRGVELSHVTLHVGVGTFATVKSRTVEGHRLHAERFELTAQAAAQINRARSEGRRIFAVGTTAVRVLEHVAGRDGYPLQPATGRTRLFIHPPCNFRVVDALITNFHLPKSTLLMLVSAFVSPGSLAGRTLLLTAYAEAIKRRYRFFSYGDAMLIL